MVCRSNFVVVVHCTHEVRRDIVITLNGTGSAVYTIPSASSYPPSRVYRTPPWASASCLGRTCPVFCMCFGNDFRSRKTCFSSACEALLSEAFLDSLGSGGGCGQVASFLFGFRPFAAGGGDACGCSRGWMNAGRRAPAHSHALRLPRPPMPLLQRHCGGVSPQPFQQAAASRHSRPLPPPPPLPPLPPLLPPPPCRHSMSRLDLGSALS